MHKQLRATWHDYNSHCIYMITLNKSRLCGHFGTLAGSLSVPSGQMGAPYVKPSAIGIAIKEALRRMGEIEPAAKIIQYVLMPDHIHFLLFVQEPTPNPLGKTIARFKVLANKLAAVEQVFAEGFNDQILKVNRSLDILYGYLRDNPRRLAVRRVVPNYFRRIDNLTIGGMKVQAYGNLQLLDNPFKEQVIVHRADDARRREHNRQSWLYNAANGGVLVSPFISPAEKSIRREAESYGSRFILITSEVFGERYKPAGHDFELCESGRLLIIAAQPRIPEAIISRETCLTLNALAERIVMHP